MWPTEFGPALCRTQHPAHKTSQLVRAMRKVLEHSSHQHLPTPIGLSDLQARSVPSPTNQDTPSMVEQTASRQCHSSHTPGRSHAWRTSSQLGVRLRSSRNHLSHQDHLLKVITLRSSYISEFTTFPRFQHWKANDSNGSVPPGWYSTGTLTRWSKTPLDATPGQNPDQQPTDNSRAAKSTNDAIQSKTGAGRTLCSRWLS